MFVRRFRRGLASRNTEKILFDSFFGAFKHSFEKDSRDPVDRKNADIIIHKNPNDEQHLEITMNIYLNNTNHLPEPKRDRLESIRDLCQQEKFSSELVKCSYVHSLVRELNDFCMSNRVVGIHYTRANKASIVERGLLCRSGDEIRRTFLEEHGQRFTNEEISKLKNDWDSPYSREEAKERDFKIFFNFTESALYNGGAEDLLNRYGGEQVSVCFCRDSCSICKKLSQIDEPLLVRCSLDPKTVSTFIDNPWGKILVSSFHNEVNPEAYSIDQDGYIEVPVPAQDIVEVNVLTNNFS